LAEQVAAAQQRLHYVARVHALEKAGTIEAEKYIATVVQHLPEGYHEGLMRRVEQARKRLFVYGKLVKALREPCIESRIVRAWQALAKVRGRVLATEDMQQRAELAQRRAPLVEALQAIPGTADDAETEQRVLEIWVPELLDDCREASRWKKIYNRSQTRRNTLREIGQALEDEDLGRAEQLLADPSLQDTDLPPQLAAELGQLRIESQQAALAKRQAIVNTLLNNQRGLFAELFDAHLLRQLCDQFRHHQPVVSQWLDEEILPAAKIGFRIDPEHAVTRDEEDRLHILWDWPPRRITQECRVGICATPPASHRIPDDVVALHMATVQREHWDPHVGYVIPMESDWEEARVYVWAVVELGFQQFFSTPFEVGQIKPLTKHTQRRWGLFWRRRRENKARREAESDQPDEDAPAAVEAPPPAEQSDATQQQTPPETS
jgi:hypothetical protein